MSKMSDADFQSIVAVLPTKRFLPDDQLKVRCEQIFDRFHLSLVLKGLTPPLKEVKNFSRKFARNARALREMVDPESVQTLKILLSVETIPDHLGRVQQGRVVKRLPDLVKQLNFFIELCERPGATTRVPALWKYVEGRKNVPPASANRQLVEELYDLFQDTTRQVPVYGRFMEFARAFTSPWTIFRVTEDMIHHQLRPIIRQRKARPNHPVAKGSDSTKSNIAPQLRPRKTTTMKSRRSG